MTHPPCAPTRAAPPPPPPGDTALSFALDACDDVEAIRDLHRAFACIEKLIAPAMTIESDDFAPSRSEFGALVTVLNRELLQRVEAAQHTLHALCGALQQGHAVAAPHGP